jgi:hypothetical protein
MIDQSMSSGPWLWYDLEQAAQSPLRTHHRTVEVHESWYNGRHVVTNLLENAKLLFLLGSCIVLARHGMCV